MNLDASTRRVEDTWRGSRFQRPQHGRRSVQSQTQRVVARDDGVDRRVELLDRRSGRCEEQLGLVQSVDAAAELREPLHDRRHHDLAEVGSGVGVVDDGLLWRHGVGRSGERCGRPVDEHLLRG